VVVKGKSDVKAKVKENKEKAGKKAVKNDMAEEPEVFAKTKPKRALKKMAPQEKALKKGSERESVEESILGGFLKSDEFDLGRSQTLCLE
jgi:hypothetical protein